MQVLPVVQKIVTEATLMLNRFVDNSQFSLIGSANNVNDQGFSGGGGGPRFRNSNGLTATKMLGANFATQTEKLELGGKVPVIISVIGCNIYKLLGTFPAKWKFLFKFEQ